MLGATPSGLESNDALTQGRPKSGQPWADGRYPFGVNCPEGTAEQSPTFQLWDRVQHDSRPEGTVEFFLSCMGFSAVPSGLTFHEDGKRSDNLLGRGQKPFSHAFSARRRGKPRQV